MELIDIITPLGVIIILIIIYGNKILSELEEIRKLLEHK